MKNGLDHHTSSIRLPLKSYEQLKAIADADRRPLANLIVMLLDEWLESQPAQAPKPNGAHKADKAARA